MTQSSLANLGHNAGDARPELEALKGIFYVFLDARAHARDVCSCHVWQCGLIDVVLTRIRSGVARLGRHHTPVTFRTAVDSFRDNNFDEDHSA